MSSSSKEKTSEDPRKELSYEERKKLTRAVAQAEKKIEKLETTIADFETRMATSEFYALPDAQEQIQAYQDAKEALDQAFEDWDAAEKALGGGG